jgi:amino acid transporter
MSSGASPPSDRASAPESTSDSAPARSDLPALDAASNGLAADIQAPLEPERPALWSRVKRLVIGKPRDLADQSLFRHVSLIAFLAWVGLGADGLSSSCYGPPEAFINLQEHSYLAIFLAMAIAGTVFVISTCYSHIIEEFPGGGGGYLVASKLLGNRIGVVSGCALLVDYVLTITASTAAAGDALFGLIDPSWAYWKLPTEYAVIVLLIVLNLRGVKESVQFLMPIFLLFLATHAVLIVGSIVLHLPQAGTRSVEIAQQIQTGFHDPDLGLVGMLAILLYAYSLGAGTYTGLEAVSNSMPVMREPRVATARKTMRYMAFSLAFTAAGLIVAYLLLGIKECPGKTLNQVLTESFITGVGLDRIGMGTTFLLATLISEGALLFVAAQAGFIDGPRVLGYMAHDSWMPRWFANLSERLATQNGILLMGIAALGALWYTGGNILTLVIMYSINVFVTFSLSMIGMCRHWIELRRENPLWRRRLALFLGGALLCVSILAVNVWEKFWTGGWVTLAVTSACIALCFLIHRYYVKVGKRLKLLDETLCQIVGSGTPTLAEPDPSQPAAVVLVGGYSGLGIHTLLNAVRFAPNHFRSFIFISVGVVDAGNFKGSSAVEELRAYTEDSLLRYVELGQKLGMPTTSFYTIGTDAVDELEQLCLEVSAKFPKATFFAGQLVFQKDTWLHRFLHNQTAYSLQRRLQWAGLPMVILPTRVR